MKATELAYREEVARQIWNNWLAESRKGNLCGVLRCRGKPSERCSHCGCWYCDKHMYRIKRPEHKGDFKPIGEVE